MTHKLRDSLQIVCNPCQRKCFRMALILCYSAHFLMSTVCPQPNRAHDDSVWLSWLQHITIPFWRCGGCYGSMNKTFDDINNTNIREVLLELQVFSGIHNKSPCTSLVHSTISSSVTLHRVGWGVTCCFLISGYVNTLKWIVLSSIIFIIQLLPIFVLRH